MKKYFFTLIGFVVAPQLTYAATATTGSGVSDFNGLIGLLTGFATKLIGLLVTVALVVFFYRIVASIYKVGNDPKAVAQGKTLLLWGIIALFVMVSVWGIVIFLGNAIGIHTGDSAIIPQLEGHN